MTLIDSLDSILMLYSYSNFPDRSLAVFEKGKVRLSPEDPLPSREDAYTEPADPTLAKRRSSAERPTQSDEGETSHSRLAAHPAQESHEEDMTKKANVMSGLSIILTIMSILVAFAYVRLGDLDSAD